MRVVCLCLALAVSALSACATEDPFPIRPAGGSTGGADNLPDRPDADPRPDTELRGRVCVILDLPAPFACPDIALGRGVTIRDATGTTTATSGNDTTFTLEVMAVSSVILDVGSQAEGLRPTRSIVNNGSSDALVDAVVIEQTLWDSTLLNLLELETTGSLLVYVRDADGPIAGATVTLAGAPADMRTYYDDDAGGFDIAATATGAAGMALLVDAGPGQVTAREDTGHIADVITMPFRGGATSVGVITLPRR